MLHYATIETALKLWNQYWYNVLHQFNGGYNVLHKFNSRYLFAQINFIHFITIFTPQWNYATL